MRFKTPNAFHSHPAPLQTDPADRALRKTARARFHSFGVQPGTTKSRLLRTQIEPVQKGGLPALGQALGRQEVKSPNRSNTPAPDEDDLRARTTQVERTLAQCLNSLSLIEGARRVHELDL